MSNPRVQPEAPKQGDQVTYSIDVTNTGNTENSITIQLKGSVTQKRYVTIGSKQTITVAFTFTVPAVSTLVLRTNGMEVSVPIVPPVPREPIDIVWS
jgi:hypothetical protein